MTERSQEEVVAFLEDGAAYGTPGEDVRHIDTHAARVFLAGAHAYKIKRAVTYDFLDFSTLEKRRVVLERELELNRLQAPELYEAMLPVTRQAGGGLSLGGEGEVVEWVLRMRRFDHDARLDRVAERGGLDDALVERLAEVVAGFHAAAEVRPDYGGIAGIRAVVDGNDGFFKASKGRHRALLEAAEAMLEARRMAGRVRLCHGDLHLANIALVDGKPLLFDRIEFNDAFACIDVLYDLAFLLMDLMHRRRRAAARHLLEIYLDHACDEAGLSLLPLFMACRAAIRARVESLTAELDEGPHREEQARYEALAQDLLVPRPPMLVAIGGLSGSGKSTLARRLAPDLGTRPGAVVMRSDVTRKRLFGVAPTERLPQEAYTPEVSARVFEKIAERATLVLAAGHSVVADGVYGERRHRDMIRAAAARAGVPFTGIWLDAPMATLVERVDARQGDASDATAAVVRSQLERAPADIDWPRIDASGGIEAVEVAARDLLAASSGTAPP